ncbi:MAG: recombinase family protein [bacterium]|nr:recombinase family protein [bacterium]
MVTAGIYARISSDPDGTRLGVQRQIDDCRSLADRLGWTVADEYVDNDVSAWSGKKRPEYRRMLDNIKNGVIDGILVWHPDRLHRHPKELEELIDLVEGVGNIRIETVTAGDFDLSTSAGRSIARIVGAIARKDSDDNSARGKRKAAELAAAGKVAGGGNRPFGYEADKLTINPTEAAVIREMANRVLAGDSLRSVAVDLNSRGIRTAKGNEWNSGGIKRVLMWPRISGRRERAGEFYTAVWPGIITPEESDRLRRKLSARNRSTGRPPRRYLLTGGLLRCGRCGAAMKARPSTRGRRYVCPGDPGLGGCGRMSATADPLEQFVVEAVLYRLDSPELAATLKDTRAQQSELSELHDQVAADQAMLDELADDWANKVISRSEWMSARDPINKRIEQGRRRLARISPTTAIDDYAGNTKLLRSAWADLPLSRQQAIVKVLVDHVVVNPAVPGRGFDPQRFAPIWRL